MNFPLRFKELIRSSAILKVAVVLIGVQMATGMVAVLLSSYLAESRSLQLVESALRTQLDVVAEEIEQRAGPLRFGTDSLPPTLRADLADRFPDPIYVVSPTGVVVDRIGQAPPLPTLAPELQEWLASGQVVVRATERDRSATFGLVPFYDEDGWLAGGLLVKPFAQSIARELAPTRAAFQRALFLNSLLALLVALVLGGLFAWRLVLPLRRIMNGVEQIGRGDYSSRLLVEGHDETARLADAVNDMAAQVQHSISTLRQADQLRRELLANVSHDLRTPLAALDGYIEESARHLPEEARLSRSHLEDARQQSRYLTHLLSDLFELSVLEAAPDRLHMEPVPMGELLHEVVRMQRPLYDRDRQRLEASIPPHLPVLQADGGRLMRLFGNVLDNARQHTPEGGSVWFTAHADAGEIVISARDSGPGIATDILPTLFERYVRGEDARTRRREGTGLGLAIAFSIARAHHGSLEASNHPDGGAEFICRLPAPEPVS